MIKKIKFQGQSVEVIIKNPKEHIQKHWMAGNFYEAHKNGLLPEIYRREKKGGVFIDVGACIGNHSLFFSEVMGGSVLAFEPQINNYVHLTENVSRNQANVQCYYAALGATEGTGTMVSSGDNTGMFKLSNGNEVNIYTLDSCIGNWNVLKIDVEGYNKEVLLGAKRILTEGSGNVYIECDSSEILKETDQIMTEYGYQRADLVMNHTPTYLYVKVR